MPLNPNGKIDKPALPFPDTAQLAVVDAARADGKQSTATPTETAIQAIWTRILTNTSSIPLDENFFDLGGHSILATRLIFEIRKAFLVDAPLGLVFDNLMCHVRPENVKLRQRCVRIISHIARVGEPAASDALERHGDVPRAVLGLAGLSAAEADRALVRAGGNLRAALAATSPGRASQEKS